VFLVRKYRKIEKRHLAKLKLRLLLSALICGEKFPILIFAKSLICSTLLCSPVPAFAGNGSNY
ncbi:MAG TPA: hypothetical protein DCS91_19670, partial [Microcoleaceae bacterium UBA11344]|nr:hypothetical protein [Microcoleaceae cyanobacterium UBA11344]